MPGGATTLIDWNRIYGVKAWIDWFEAECRRKLADFITDIDDVCQEAQVKLFTERLPNSSVAHRENLDGYVRTVYRSILEDLRRAHFGRPRTPSYMERQGPPISDIFALHCLEKLPVAVIVAETGLPDEEVEHWVAWLREKDRCTIKRRSVAFDDTVSLTRRRPDGGEDDDSQQDLPDASTPMTEAVEDELTSFLSVLFGLDDEYRSDEEMQTRMQRIGRVLSDRIDDLRAELALTDEDRILFRLVFVEGLSVTKAAAELDEKTHTVRRGLHARLGEIKSVLLAYGLDLQSLGGDDAR